MALPAPNLDDRTFQDIVELFLAVVEFLDVVRTELLDALQQIFGRARRRDPLWGGACALSAN